MTWGKRTTDSSLCQYFVWRNFYKERPGWRFIKILDTISRYFVSFKFISMKRVPGFKLFGKCNGVFFHISRWKEMWCIHYTKSSSDGEQLNRCWTLIHWVVTLNSFLKKKSNKGEWYTVKGLNSEHNVVFCKNYFLSETSIKSCNLI